jgi:DNA (cytosine-5)-methyltransferase 1
MVTAIDNFCGAGGSTTGLKAAGIRVVHAANHWERAIESHNTNHPEVDHSCVDLHIAHPSYFPKTDIGWFSIECTTFSPSGGRKRKHPGQLDLFNPKKPDPSVERSRMGAWDVVNFAEFHRYQLVMVENVLEFTEWELYDHWLKAMHTLGYSYQVVCFNSQFAGVPQSRDRIYVVFHRSGNRKPNVDFQPLASCEEHGEIHAVQSWKNQRRVGKYKAQYVYVCPKCGVEVMPHRVSAAAAIDWSLPCPKIKDRQRPLSEATLRRVEKGLKRFADAAFFVHRGYSTAPEYDRTHSIDEPAPTQTTSAKLYLAQPLIDTLRNNATPRPVDEPTTTVTAQGRHHALVMPPFLAAYHGGRDSVRSIDEPSYTIATSNQTALIQPFVSGYYGNGSESPVSSPSPTIRTVQGHALVTPDWSALVEDCGYRMITAEEAKQLMGFPENYVLVGNQSERYKQAGNAVTPPVAEILGRAAIASLEVA